jgi:hypothetical protein
MWLHSTSGLAVEEPEGFTKVSTVAAPIVEQRLLAVGRAPGSISPTKVASLDEGIELKLIRIPGSGKKMAS